eukprot:6236307-Pyramimonas_sp.AAC.1
MLSLVRVCRSLSGGGFGGCLQFAPGVWRSGRLPFDPKCWLRRGGFAVCPGRWFWWGFAVCSWRLGAVEDCRLIQGAGPGEGLPFDPGCWLGWGVAA